MTDQFIRYLIDCMLKNSTMIKTDDSVKMVKHVYAMAMKFSIHSLWWDIVEGNGVVAQSTKAIILPEILDMLL